MMDNTPVSETRFSLFRIVLGSYLLFYLWMVWPDAVHLYTINGIPKYEPFVYGPGINWLRYADRPEDVGIFFVCLLAAVSLFTLGIFRRVAALAVFYGFFCMFTMGDYATCVANPYIGWTVLACSLVPSGERWSVDHLRLKPAPGDWKFPALVYWGGWMVFAVSYASSGIDKWFYAPKWSSGAALSWMLGSPFYRRWWLTAAVQKAVLGSVGKGLTWFTASAELAALPACLFRKGRALIWTVITLMHIGVLLLIRIPMVSTGMLVFHLFVFDERWLQRDFWRTTGPENVNISSG